LVDNKLTQADAVKLFQYNRETGELFWKKSKQGVRPSRLAGSVDKKGYIIVVVNGFPYKAHRLIWLIVYGEYPPDQIDHVNRVKDDNRIGNLRSVNTQVNMMNVWLYVSYSSGVSGVYWYKNDKKWVSAIKVYGDRKHLGVYREWFDAVCARKSAEVKYNFNQAYGASCAA